MINAGDLQHTYKAELLPKPMRESRSKDACPTLGWQGAYEQLHFHILYPRIPKFTKIDVVIYTQFSTLRSLPNESVAITKRIASEMFSALDTAKWYFYLFQKHEDDSFAILPLFYMI